MKKVATLYQVDGDTVTIAQIGARLGLSHGAAYARLQTVLKRRVPITWQALGEGAGPSRAMQIVRYVVAIGRSATLDEIVDFIAEREPDADRRALAVTISAQLSQLSTRFGKLKRSGKARAYTYLPTDAALLDRRKAAPQPGRRAAAPPKPSPVPKPPARPAIPAAKPVIVVTGTAATKRPGEFSINPAKPPPVLNANLTRPREGSLDSAHIAAHIAAFEASGGRVERLPNGLTSQPMKCYLAAQAAARRPHPSNDSDLDADDFVDVA